VLGVWLGAVASEQASELASAIAADSPRRRIARRCMKTMRASVIP
jgi:hypothetical protein